MIFTNCGLLGDMFLCLPVLSWYSKNHNEKIVFALADHFAYSKDAEALLRMQPFIYDVIYFNYDESICESRHPGNLGNYHIPKKVFNGTAYEGWDVTSLGFHKWPDKYVPELYAEEYGLGVDYDFRLNYGNPNYKYKEYIVKVDKFEDPHLIGFDGINLCSPSMHENLQYAAGAGKVVTFTTGFSIMAALARIPIELWSYRHLIDHHAKYFDIAGKINWRYFEDVR